MHGHGLLYYCNIGVHGWFHKQTPIPFSAFRTLSGVTSWGRDRCGTNKGVYTDVTNNKISEWIRGVIEKRPDNNRLLFEKHNPNNFSVIQWILLNFLNFYSLAVCYILSQSSGDFDPEAYPELEKPPDQSETSFRRNYRKTSISIQTKIILKSYIMEFLEMIQRLQLLIWHLIDPDKIFWSSGWLRWLGRYLLLGTHFENFFKYLFFAPSIFLQNNLHP